MSGSGISWAICKSAPRSRQITMPAPHHCVFLQARCPFCHPTNSVKTLKAQSTVIMYKPAPKQSTCCTSQVSVRGEPARQDLSSTPVIDYHSCHLKFSIHYKNPASSVSQVNFSRHCQLSYLLRHCTDNQKQFL